MQLKSECVFLRGFERETFLQGRLDTVKVFEEVLLPLKQISQIPQG